DFAGLAVLRVPVFRCCFKARFASFSYRFWAWSSDSKDLSAWSWALRAAFLVNLDSFRACLSLALAAMAVCLESRAAFSSRAAWVLALFSALSAFSRRAA